MSTKKGNSTAKAGQDMKIVEAGSKTALSTDMKNESDQMAPDGDYSNAQKRLNTSYMNQRVKRQFGGN